MKSYRICLPTALHLSVVHAGIGRWLLLLEHVLVDVDTQGEYIAEERHGLVAHIGEGVIDVEIFDAYPDAYIRLPGPNALAVIIGVILDVGDTEPYKYDIGIEQFQAPMRFDADRVAFNEHGTFPIEREIEVEFGVKTELLVNVESASGPEYHFR